MRVGEKAIQEAISVQRNKWTAHVYCLELNLRQRNFLAARRRLEAMREIRSNIFLMQNALRISKAIE